MLQSSNLFLFGCLVKFEVRLLLQELADLQTALGLQSFKAFCEDLKLS